MRSELLEVFVKYVLPPLATLIASGAAWCLAHLGLILSTRARATKTSVGLAQLAYLSEIVVADIEAHEREAIKESAVDGKISKEEATRLLTIAKERVIALAREHGFAEAQKLLGVMAPSVGTLLSGIIERAVASLPKEAATPKTVMNVYGDLAEATGATVALRP